MHSSLTIRPIPHFGNDQVRLAVCAGLLITVTGGCRDDAAPAGDVSKTATSHQTGSDTAADDSRPFQVPDIDLENIDDAVAVAVRGAVQRVRQSPISAGRWGHLA